MGLVLIIYIFVTSLFSISIISVSLYIMLKRKPIIFHSRWFLAIFVLILLPQMIKGIFLFEVYKFLSIYMLIFFLILFIILFYTLNGYTIIGIDCDDFYKRFIEVIDNKKLNYEQSISKIVITEPKLEIYLSLQNWVGSGQVKVKGKDNINLFFEIIDLLKKSELKTKFITPILFIILGILMLIMVVIVFFISLR